MSNPRRAGFRVTLDTPLDGGENAIRFDIYHDKGGINYFTYKTEPEGYWVCTAAVTVGDGFERQAITGGDSVGRRYYIAPSSRFNFKKLQTLAEFVVDRKQQIADLTVAKNHEAVRTMLDEARLTIFGLPAAA